MEATRGSDLLGRKAVAAVLRRPDLWGEALRAVRRLAARGWYRRRPPIPAPDPAYLEWRRQTAYGSQEARTLRDREVDVGHDLVSYLEFCRALRRA